MDHRVLVFPERRAVPREAPRPAGTLSSEDAVTEAGVTYRQLDYWTRCGYVRAEQEEAGPGFPRGWSRGEVEVLALLARLVRCGFSPARASVIARAAVEESPLMGESSVEIADGLTLTVEAES